MKYANHYSWTDINPYEVVKVISEKTIEIREMDAEKDDSVKMEFVQGGFSFICTNDRDQKWHIKPNQNNRVIRIRFGKKGWKSSDGKRFKLSDQPIKYYDYNF